VTAAEPQGTLGVRIVVIGVGNRDRGDDGVGLELLERLQHASRAELPHGASIDWAPSDGDLTLLMDRLEGADVGVICDAVSSGGEPGQLHVIDVGRSVLPEDVRCASTHALGLGETLELLRVLGQLPPELWIYGVEGARYDVGAGISNEVERALPEIVHRIARDLTHWASAALGAGALGAEGEGRPCTRAL